LLWKARSTLPSVSFTDYFNATDCVIQSEVKLYMRPSMYGYPLIGSSETKTHPFASGIKKVVD